METHNDKRPELFMPCSGRLFTSWSGEPCSVEPEAADQPLQIVGLLGQL